MTSIAVVSRGHGVEETLDFCAGRQGLSRIASR